MRWWAFVTMSTALLAPSTVQAEPPKVPTSRTSTTTLSPADVELARELSVLENLEMLEDLELLEVLPLLEDEDDR